MGARAPFDHPHVFLDMGADSQILCPYCSTLYVRQTPTSGHGRNAADGCLASLTEGAA